MPGVGTTHHIELGGHYYMLRPGSYRKTSAPMFGARFTSGDPDFNNLSGWQHWAQRCFIGGADQDLWADDAMYDEGIGLDTTDHEKVRGNRGLVRGTGSNWSVSSSTTRATNGFRAVIYNSLLYVVTFASPGVESQLWRYDTATDGWVRITSLDTKNMVARSITVYDGKLFIGGVSSATGNPLLIYDDGALTSWTTVTNPAGVTQAIYAMKGFQQKLYVAYGTKVWRMKGDETWDGNVIFYNANASSGSNAINCMEVHIGFLYMLSSNGHVHRTDGNTTFDMWQWDGQTQGVAIRSFDGRLFILTFEYTNTTDVGYGVLYQMSGSAMTQLKRWGDDTQATRIGNMTAYDRRLFYGASNNLGFGAASRPGFGIACYDPIEDAHSLIANNGDTVTFTRGSAPYLNMLVDDQVFFEGNLFCFVRGHGAFKTPYKPNDYRTTSGRLYDITSAGASVGSLNGGWLTTSTYDAGMPGVKKLWRKITLDVTTPTNTAVVVEYSIDNGTSYTTAGNVTAQGARAKFDFFLNNITSTSLKLRITMRTTSGTATAILWGYIVSYLPEPEPNWQWTFTIVLASKMQLLDNTDSTVDTESELTFLGAAWRAKALLHFTDAEGVSWATAGTNPGVLITDMTVSLRDLTQPLEGEVTITLLEAVETY